MRRRFLNWLAYVDDTTGKPTAHLSVLPSLADADSRNIASDDLLEDFGW
jgi:hypothetical protein